MTTADPVAYGRAAAAAPRPLGRLTCRAEFLAAAAARRKAVTPGVILQVRQRGEADPAEVRVGFTASRKVGNAVTRNRARRRLRAAAAAVLPGRTAPGHDVVLIARAATVTRPFALLTADLLAGLKRVGALRADTGREPPPMERGP